MKIEQQCCTLEQAKKLKELGVKQQSNFKYNQNLYDEEKAGDITEGVYTIWYNQFPCLDNQYSAFTVAELGVMLQGFILPEYKQDYRLLPDKEFAWLICTSPKDYPACAETEAEARAQFLIQLIEQRYLVAEEVNQRLNA